MFAVIFHRLSGLLNLVGPGLYDRLCISGMLNAQLGDFEGFRKIIRASVFCIYPSLSACGVVFRQQR